MAIEKEQTATSGLAVASLIVGILGMFCPFLVLSLIGLILGIVGLNKIRRQGMKGRPLAIAGILTSCLGVVMFFVVAILAALLYPALASARTKARQTMELNQLKQIGMAIFIYSDDFESRTPPDMAAIVDYLGGTEVLISPTRQDRTPPTLAEVREGRIDYVYRRPAEKLMQVEDVSVTVIAHGKPENFENALCVLFADGHVEVYNDGNDIEAAAQERGWILPPLEE